MPEIRKSWVDNKTIVIAWLVFLFPVGLYAVWKGSLFDKPMQIKITAVVVGIVLFFAFTDLNGFRDFLRLFILCPIALYLLWKDSAVTKTTLYGFGGGLAVLFIMYLSGGVLGTGPGPDPHCVAVLEQNGCTYFRDSNCVVISQQCS